MHRFIRMSRDWVSKMEKKQRFFFFFFERIFSLDESLHLPAPHSFYLKPQPILGEWKRNLFNRTMASPQGQVQALHIIVVVLFICLLW